MTEVGIPEKVSDSAADDFVLEMKFIWGFQENKISAIPIFVQSKSNLKQGVNEIENFITCNLINKSACAIINVDANKFTEMWFRKLCIIENV